VVVRNDVVRVELGRALEERTGLGELRRLPAQEDDAEVVVCRCDLTLDDERVPEVSLGTLQIVVA
jgi:hypothetical protein